MPVMDGHEAIRRIRLAPGGREVKIIAVTASVIEENRQGVLAGGADDFMGKPFREAELFGKIQAHLGVEYALRRGGSRPRRRRPATSTPRPWPACPTLIRPMREAVAGADLDRLLAEIGAVEAGDPDLARGLRALAEGFEYQKLLDLFEPGRGPDRPGSGS